MWRSSGAPGRPVAPQRRASPAALRFQDDLESTAEIEGHVVDCLVAMVMKLSEVTFRSLFFKVTAGTAAAGQPAWTWRLTCPLFLPQLCDWRKSGGGERLLTFCRLTDHIAGRLKGLFILFAGNLVKPFADLLRQTSGSEAGECHGHTPPSPRVSSVSPVHLSRRPL